jgi:murein DD-endopeptidase
VALGWSVKKSQVEDFRGRDLTYDSHNGTDLSIPIGTTVVTAAPGQVVRVQSEFNRGGLKIFIDHGAGLMTCCAHLGRSLVEEGQAVGRGEPIAISGYSGLDGFVTYPFGVPHVHFNTWLDGESIDPFARPGETSMWRGGFPVPVAAGARGEAFVPSEYDEERVAGLIAGCKTPAVREHLASLSPISVRAAHAIIASNYYPTRFVDRPNPYAEAHPRSERLDMPFRADDFDRALFVDEI